MSGKLVRAHVDALDLEESYYAVDKSGADVAFFDQFVMWCRRNMRSSAAGVEFEGRDRSRDPGVGNLTLA